MTYAYQTASTTDVEAAVDLSDGTPVFATQESLFAAPGRDSVLTIDSSIGGGLQEVVGLARDSADNLYLVTYDSAASVKVAAYTKGSGYAWTKQAASTLSPTNAPQHVGAVWCDTGGGTNSDGHLLVGLGYPVSEAYVFDAGALLAGTSPVEQSSGGIGAHLIADGFGAVAGVAVSGLASNQFIATPWSVSSTGTLTLGTNVNGAAIDSGGFLRAVRVSSGVFLMLAKSPVSPYPVRAQVVTLAGGALTVGSAEDAPTSVLLYGDVANDPTLANQGYYYYVSATGAGSTPAATAITRVPIGVSGSTPTWGAAIVDDSDLANAVATSEPVLVVASAPTQDYINYLVFDSYANYVDGSSTVFQQPPYAPTLDDPANASYLDATQAINFVGTYSPRPNGNTLTGTQLRIKVSGAYSYSYFNASTNALQSTAVTNGATGGITAGQQFTVVTPAGMLANGNIYNWSLACSDQGGDGPFTSDSTFTTQAPPTVTVSAPTGTVPTQTPVISWADTLPSGASQIDYRVVVYPVSVTQEQGFTPGQTAGAAWDSSVVSSATLSAPTRTPLDSGTSYTAYVQVTESGGQTSNWGSSSFTIAVLTPAATPTLSATPTTDANGTPCVALVTAGHDNVLSTDDASFEFGVGTWAAGTNWDAPVRDTTYALDGSYSAKCVRANTTVGSGYIQNAPSPAAAGQEITALVSIHGDSTSTGKGYRAYLLTTPSGTKFVLPDLVASASGWVSSAVVATVPSGDTAAALTVSDDPQTAPSAGQTIWVDECLIRPAYPDDTTNLHPWTSGGLVGGGEFTSTAFLVSYTDANNPDPVQVRSIGNGQRLPLPSQLSTDEGPYYDYEVVPGLERTYTAVVEELDPTVSAMASAGASATATLSTTTSYILPTSGAQTAVNVTFIDTKTSGRTRSQTSYAILGRPDVLTVTDVAALRAGTMTIYVPTQVALTALTALLDSTATLFCSRPDGTAFYFAVGSDPRGSNFAEGLTAKRLTGLWAPDLTLTLGWVEKERP